MYMRISVEVLYIYTLVNGYIYTCVLGYWVCTGNIHMYYSLPLFVFGVPSCLLLPLSSSSPPWRSSSSSLAHTSMHSTIIQALKTSSSWHSMRRRMETSSSKLWLLPGIMTNRSSGWSGSESLSLSLSLSHFTFYILLSSSSNRDREDQLNTIQVHPHFSYLLGCCYMYIAGGSKVASCSISDVKVKYKMYIYICLCNQTPPLTSSATHSVIIPA